jgi:polyhydroxyalkanoate synthesis regulator phasin
MYMNDLLRSSLLFGMGVYAKTRRQTAKAVRGLVRKNKLSRKEGERVVADVVLRSRTMEKKIAKEVGRMMTKARVKSKRIGASSAQLHRILLPAIKRLKAIARADAALLKKKVRTVSKRVLSR